MLECVCVRERGGEKVVVDSSNNGLDWVRMVKERICAYSCIDAHTRIHSHTLSLTHSLTCTQRSRLMAAMCVSFHKLDSIRMHTKQNLKTVASIVSDLEHMFGDSHYLTMRSRLLQGDVCV